MGIPKHRPFRVNTLTVMRPFQGRWMVGLLSIQIGVNPYPMLFDPFRVFPQRPMPRRGNLT